MSVRIRAAAALALLGGLLGGATPASAQPPSPEFCFTNASTQLVVRQVRFRYTPRGGVSTETPWRTLYNGTTHCQSFGDIVALRFQTRVHSGVHWASDCAQTASPSRSATFVIEGTSFNSRCRLQQ